MSKFETPYYVNRDQAYTGYKELILGSHIKTSVKPDVCRISNKFEATLFDSVNPDDGDFFVDAYTQQRPEVLVLSPWIQKFVDQARKDGVHVEAMVKPDRSHC
ncbi:hypothetical protein KI688_011902 [Linnemannia hyalina]|uniref:Uncharacterized protein n=1 Tax=Linnemannia hyalina TaxID=64524 RepID=A0A9P8BTJ4_9FUNG|nr:hypothetical protein KI688_011902 [Linnemannia hyalina]